MNKIDFDKVNSAFKNIATEIDNILPPRWQDPDWIAEIDFKWNVRCSAVVSLVITQDGKFLTQGVSTPIGVNILKQIAAYNRMAMLIAILGLQHVDS